MKRLFAPLMIGTFVVVALGFLFAWPRLFPAPVASGAVPCLVPNRPLTVHVHPTLKIFISNGGGEKIEETVPSDIGLDGACEYVLHTHDGESERGVIHVESQDARRYTLGDFFAVWKKPLIREGYTLEVRVDGEIVPGPATIPLKDKEAIEFRYTAN
ncbi:MAG: hypothetical protein AAB601_02395 [Patescibacteria group bacterium]